MEINATLLGQMITFFLFVWFTLKFIWPPLMKAIKERQRKISAGLNAAERGNKSLALAQQKSKEIMQEAKGKASDIVDKAHTHAGQIIDEEKAKGKAEYLRITEHGKKDVEQQVSKAKETLSADLAALVIVGAEKILEKEIDKAAHNKMIEELISRI